MGNLYSGEGMILRAQMAASISNYIDNIPNMSAYQVGYDLGFGAEKVAESVLLTRGAGAVVNGVKAFRVAKTLKNTTVATTTYTKSSLQLGQQMHRLYKIKDVLPDVRIKEFRLPSGKRVDFIDFEKRIIYELKPNNPRQIKAGTIQLKGYLDEVQSLYGSGWRVILDLY